MESVGVYVCLSQSVGVQYVTVCVCVCRCVFTCDIWSGCHADRTLCINHRDRIIDLGGRSEIMFGPTSVKLHCKRNHSQLYEYKAVTQVKMIILYVFC